VSEPEWVEFARRFIGQSEIPGKGSNPFVKGLWEKLNLGWLWKAGGEDDSLIPWCGGFVGSVFVDCGIQPTRNPQRALAWLDWGIVLPFPVVGCVVVFERKGGGHVGFVVGRDQNENLMVLGGNQADAVNVKPFSQDRVKGYRWPKGEVVVISKLPLIESGVRVSTNES
jgi:uncharacterized protein (TIGR02594 family)